MSHPATRSDTPVLQAEHLALAYRDGPRLVRAVDDVSLTVEAGAFIGIVGPSGSGKSSLLFLLAGLRRPDAGQVSICGTRLPPQPERSADIRRASVGFLFQEPFLVPYLSVRENALIHIERRRSSDRDAAAAHVEALAKDIGMADMLEERPHRLSGGERQRAGILRALANRPRLILADEPTASLDQDTGHAVMRALRERSGAAALVVVTHDPAMLEGADRIHVLRDGTLEKPGSSPDQP